MMRQTWSRAVFAALVALGGCGKPAPEAQKAETPEGGPGITLSAAEQQGLGLVTVPLQATTWRGQVSGFGVVMAQDAVAQSDADLATAEAAARQSQAAAARAKTLSTGDDAAVSREVYEAAASKAAADQATLTLARRKADAAFGLGAPWHSGARRAALLARLQDGRMALVHVTFPAGLAGPVSRLTITRMGAAAKSWTAAAVWDAPADPAIPGRSVFALVDGGGLAPGERVTAAMPVGAPQTGVIVPSAALVLGESDNWVYRQIKPGTYLRARIDTSHPVAGGYFVAGGQASGLAPGQAVVTGGAGLLYAHEINPSTEPEE